MKSIVLIDSEHVPSHLTSHYYSTSMTEPLGLLYLESFLVHHGVDVAVLRYPLTSEDWQRVCAAEIVGISGLTYVWPTMLEVARSVRMRNPQAIIVAGREHASCCPELVLNHPEFDLVIAGEGELGLLALAQGTSWGKVPGAVYQDEDGALRRVSRGQRLGPEDVFPLRRRKEWMVNMFQETEYLHSHQAGLVMGRGCLFKCKFCTAPEMWRGFASQGVKNAIDEIIRTHEQHGIKYFAMHDLMLNASPRETELLCHEVIKRDLHLSFFGFLSATNGKINLKLMKQAGFNELGIGIEIPGPRRIDIGKKFSFSTVRRFFEAVSDAGIFTKAYAIIGWPWDTDEEDVVDRYVRALRTVPVNNLRITFVTPFPGTKTYDEWQDHIPFELTDNAFSRFTTMEPILDFGLSVRKLQRIREKILSGYFSSPEFNKLITSQSRLKVIDAMNSALRGWALGNGLVVARGKHVPIFG